MSSLIYFLASKILHDLNANPVFRPAPPYLLLHPTLPTPRAPCLLHLGPTLFKLRPRAQACSSAGNALITLLSSILLLFQRLTQRLPSPGASVALFDPM